MKISRRKSFDIFGFGAFFGMFYQNCKSNQKVNQVEVYNNEPIENLQPGFRVLSPEGLSGLNMYNNTGKIIGKYMQIVNTTNPLSITDLAWEKYKINGLVKKWKFDEQDWQNYWQIHANSK